MRPTPTLWKKTVNNVSAILRDLQAGPGSQQLSPALRGIEIIGIHPKRQFIGHRRLLKTILPRIKYNNAHLKIKVDYIVPTNEDTTDGAKTQTTATSSAVTVEPATAAEEQNGAKSSKVFARLTFHGYEPQDVKLSSSSEELTLKKLFTAIARVTGEAPAELTTAQESVADSHADTEAQSEGVAQREPGLEMPVDVEGNADVEARASDIGPDAAFVPETTATLTQPPQEK